MKIKKYRIKFSEAPSKNKKIIDPDWNTVEKLALKQIGDKNDFNSEKEYEEYKNIYKFAYSKGFTDAQVLMNSGKLKEETSSPDQVVDVFSTEGLKANYKNPQMSLDVFSNLDNEKIPVTKYFKYGYSYPRELESLINVLMIKIGEEAFWNLFNETKPSIIDFNYITPTISYLSRLEIHLKYQGQTDLEKLPLFIEYAGRYFCIFGHIETVNQAKFGKRIRGKCISFDKLMGLVK